MQVVDRVLLRVLLDRHSAVPRTWDVNVAKGAVPA